MKNVCTLLAALLIITACHKKPGNTITPAVNTRIHGLTSVSYPYKYSGSNPVYLYWSFSGGDTLSIRPSQDSFSFSYLHAYFTGTDIVHIQGSDYHTVSATSSIYPGCLIDVKYRSQEIIDTLTNAYTTIYFPIEKAAFQYTGNHISKVIVARNSGGLMDIDWSRADNYTYTYNGDNIIQIDYDQYAAGSRYVTTYRYFPGSKANNLAGSMPAFLLLKSLKPDLELNSLLLDMPLYVNTTFTDSILFGARDKNVMTNVTDADGRIAQRIQHTNTSQPDTTFYHY